MNHFQVGDYVIVIKELSASDFFYDEAERQSYIGHVGRVWEVYEYERHQWGVLVQFPSPSDDQAAGTMTVGTDEINLVSRPTTPIAGQIWE